jgi:hypothetical protein
MNKEKYFAKSLKQKLPNRCPILSYCSRRAQTIYLFNKYSKIFPEKEIIEALLSEGQISTDYSENEIKMIGELPEILDGKSYGHFLNACPEINLFDPQNALNLFKGTASTEGTWDTELSPKFKVIETKHYSECAEFSKHYFDIKNAPKKSVSATKKRRTPISKELRFEIFQRDNFTCQYCGKTKNEAVKLEVDHIQPISTGGTDDYNNLITSCKECNQGKSNKVIK